MNRFMSLVATVLLSCLVASSQAFAVDEAKLVETAFDAYKNALIKAQGKVAAGLATKETLDWYQNVKDLALKADETETRKLNIITKFTVLRLRLEFKAKELAAMSSSDIFAYGVDKGWIGKESVANLSIHEVKVDGDNALVQVKSGAQIVPEPKFKFQKQNKTWKIDLNNLMEVGEKGFEMMAKQQGMEADAFVEVILENLTGKKVPATTWKGIA